MAANSQASSSSLLGLPREIRDSIYDFVFGDFALPRKVVCWPYPDYLHASSHSPSIYDTTKNIPGTSILRICRQIRSEAYVVMLKKHQLIRITVNNVLLSPHLIGAMLHIVSLSDRALDTYPGFIMTHNIEGEQDPEAHSSSQPWVFALPWRDLGMFCRAVTSGHVFSLDAKAEIHHQVTMHDPFATTCSPEYMCLNNQTKFLQPYQDYLGGVAHFNIIGKVDNNLAASLKAEIQKMPPVDVNKMLNKFTRVDATGQRQLLGRGFAKFSRACLKSLVEVSRLVDTDAWLESGPGGRPNQHVKAVRDIFNILSREHGAAEWEETEEDHTWHLSRAIQAAASLLAERAPSPAQKSTVYYLNAKAHRYFSGSPAAAESMLRLALDMVAGEAFDDWKEQCLEEGQEIVRWKEIRNDSTPVHGQDSAGPSSIEETKPDTISGSEDNAPDTTSGSTELVKRQAEDSQMTQNIWIFIFRGYPYDTYNKRHTLFYFDSPDVEDFHITAHAQRPTEDQPFEYTENSEEQNYPMSIDLIHGRIVGKAQVDVSQHRKLVDVIASTPVGGEPDWNCQHFVYHALERLSDAGAISEEQLNDSKDWMMDSLLDGAIG